MILAIIDVHPRCRMLVIVQLDFLQIHNSILVCVTYINILILLHVLTNLYNKLSTLEKIRPFSFMLFYFILLDFIKKKIIFVENVLLICILLAYAKIERFQISPLRTYNKDIFEKIIYENTFVISTKC
jgi:hypothetical protein